MRPIFCGNFEYDARQSDLERLFRRYGKVDRVDMKSGFAFVYMEDERDAEDAIRALDRIELGRKGRKLRVEWTKEERSSRRPESSRRSSSNLRPSKTLFIINFDPYHTRTRDLERHFDPYGKILNVKIRRNFAFIQYESQEDATKALAATNMSKLLNRIITVEYAIKDDDERQNVYSPDRAREKSPGRGHDRVRSPSTHRREKESPDYGHGSGHSPSPYSRERANPDYVRGSDRSPSRKDRDLEHGPGLTPSPRRERDTGYNQKHRSRPQGERPAGDISNGPNPRKGLSSDYGHGTCPGPRVEQRESSVSPDDYANDRSPAHNDAESPPPDRFGSQSPLARERS